MLIEIFRSSKFDNIFPSFLPILDKRKVLTGLVSPILKLGQKVIGISDFIGPQFVCYTEGIEMGRYFLTFIQFYLILLIQTNFIQEKMQKIFGIPGSNTDPPGAHD